MWTAGRIQPKSFSVDPQRRVLRLYFESGEGIEIDERGVVLEKEKWLEMQIKAFPPNAIPSVLSQEIAEGDSDATVLEKLKLLVEILERLSNAGIEKQCARLAKVIGEHHERLGYRCEAITFYEKALKLDPRIGLKKHLEELKKQTR